MVVGDFIICLLAFFNIFIYLFIIITIFISKKRGPERGLEGGPERGPEGRVHVLSTPALRPHRRTRRVGLCGS